MTLAYCGLRWGEVAALKVARSTMSRGVPQLVLDEPIEADLRGRKRQGRASHARPASVAMTLDRYSGLFGDELDAVGGRLDEAARDSRGAPGAPRTHRDSGYSQ
jgi:hypothetical protein